MSIKAKAESGADCTLIGFETVYDSDADGLSDTPAERLDETACDATDADESANRYLSVLIVKLPCFKKLTSPSI